MSRWAVVLLIGLLSLASARAENAAPKVFRSEFNMYWLRQKVDHFSGKSRAHFDQKYWVNSAYATNAESPVLLFICGEALCDEDVISGAEFAAQALGAHVVALEHRFYGDSRPNQSLANKSLKTLTVENVLVDLAQMQDWVKLQHQFSGPWIAMGGSYSGALAAYFHSTYPKRTVGALAYSAPVRADLDAKIFSQEYENRLSPSCRADLIAALDIFRALTWQRPAEAQQWRAQFHGANIQDNDDLLVALEDLLVFVGASSRRERLCAKMQNQPSPLAGAREIFNEMAIREGVDISEISYHNKHVGALDQPTGPSDMRRQWRYQICTQLGFWMVPGEHEGVFPYITEEDLKADCYGLFGVAPPDIARFNKTFYQPLLTRENLHIVFVNGEQDPWRWLSILPGQDVASPKIKSFLIPGAGHVPFPSADSSFAVKAINKKAIDEVKSWLPPSSDDKDKE